MDRWLNKILLGLSEDVLGELPDNCIDSIVTDPPYGLKFMGKKWDYDVPSVALWEEAYRVLKPGAHVLSFGGTRTYHRMVVNIEDAGFEIRDQILWIYGSGFPKSLNIGKAIAGIRGEEIKRGVLKFKGGTQLGVINDDNWKPKDVYDEQVDNEWSGWGTALKPACEPICLARKPIEKTVANNVLKWGTGGMNIDECRVEPTGERLGGGGEKRATFSGKEGWGRPWMDDPIKASSHAKKIKGNVERASELGRFPANVIHDGSDEVLQHFPESNGQQGAVTGNEPSSSINNCYGQFNGRPATTPRNDNGSAARFFKQCNFTEDENEQRIKYCAKASTSERGDGNNHPTVKPLDLIKYLVKLITPPDGIVLDMFGGSGTTALACLDLGFPYIVIDKEPDHVFIANERIKQATRQERIFL